MISDTEARRISSEWHGGGGTALYALSSTGAINTARADHIVSFEIDDCFTGTGPDTPESGLDELYELLQYVWRYGPRGPVDGWSKLTWSTR